MRSTKRATLRSVLGTGLAAGALAVATPVAAGTDTGTLNVTAQVQSGCMIESNSLNFGTYTAGQTQDLDAEVDLMLVNCPAGTHVLSLDGGASGNTQERYMTGDNGTLNYQLYRNSTSNGVFGEVNDAEIITQFLPGNVFATVYGRVFGGQLVDPGTYTDTVTMTLEFNPQ